MLFRSVISEQQQGVWCCECGLNRRLVWKYGGRQIENCLAFGDLQPPLQQPHVHLGSRRADPFVSHDSQSEFVIHGGVWCWLVCGLKRSRAEFYQSGQPAEFLIYRLTGNHQRGTVS